MADPLYCRRRLYLHAQSTEPTHSKGFRSTATLSTYPEHWANTQQRLPLKQLKMSRRAAPCSSIFKNKMKCLLCSYSNSIKLLKTELPANYLGRVQGSSAHSPSTLTVLLKWKQGEKAKCPATKEPDAFPTWYQYALGAKSFIEE